jgi:hypothetical protein
MDPSLNTLNTALIYEIIGAAIIAWLLFILINVYNTCKGMEVKLNELLTNAESIKIKLNNVYSEIYKLLNKYSIHETDIMKAVATGQANIQVLASRYPQLRSDILFQNASNNWSDLYDELQKSIFQYNSIITDYNTYVTNFPRLLFCLILKRKNKNHAKIN